MTLISDRVGTCSKAVAIALIAMVAGQGFASDSVVLSYRRLETFAPNPNWSASKDQLQWLENTYRNEGLTDDQVRQNLAVHAKEDDLIRKGRTTQYDIDVIVKDHQLAVRRQSASGADAIEEYLDDDVYGFFYGSNKEVPEYANGSVASVDYTSNDAKKGPPNNWLPDTVGHRFALCLVGFTPIKQVLGMMQLQSDEKGARLYREGRYYWRLKPGADDDPFSEITWQVASPVGYVGESLVVDDWLDVGGRKCAKTFHIVDWNKDGTRGKSRDFSLVYSSVISRADTKHLFAMIPSNTLVVDSRPQKPASYRLQGRIPRVDEIEGVAVPTVSKRAATGPSSVVLPWFIYAIGSLLVVIVGGSFYMAFRGKTT